MAYEYHLSPILAAEEGDMSVLCERAVLKAHGESK
jgi:hypothetical protein